MIRRLVGLLSATSTGRPSSSLEILRWYRTRRALRQVERAVKWKVVPLPTVLSYQIRPPIRPTNWDAMASPSPVPPNLRVVELSACEKAWKMVGPFSAGNSDPGVTHRKAQLRLVRGQRIESHPEDDFPCSVNLIALPTMFISTWRSRAESPISTSGISISISHISSRSFRAPGTKEFAEYRPGRRGG